MLRVLHVTTIFTAEYAVFTIIPEGDDGMKDCVARIDIRANMTLFSWSKYLLNSIPMKKKV